MPRRAIDLFVLTAIGLEAETYDAIVREVNDEATGWQERHGGPIQGIEVQAALLRLVKDRLVEVFVYGSSKEGLVGCGEGVWPQTHALGDMYFDLTGRGTVLYLNSDP